MLSRLLAKLTNRSAAPVFGAARFGLGQRNFEQHPAHIPPGQRVYAVGDVHGCSAQLNALLALIEADAADTTDAISLIFLGDYIDRGPASRAVLETLRTKPWPSTWQSIFLRGNHDQALLDFVENPATGSHWLGWGGETVLPEYGISWFNGPKRKDLLTVAAELKAALVQAQHLAVLENTVLYHTVGDYLFVHAGVRPMLPLADQLEHELMFIRDDFVGHPHGQPYRVVFGHTIMPQPFNQPDCLGVDTGAFSGGPLTAAVLSGCTTKFLQV
jgi:serine/threonine protein phosphatase 1